MEEEILQILRWLCAVCSVLLRPAIREHRISWRILLPYGPAV